MTVNITGKYDGKLELIITDEVKSNGIEYVRTTVFTFSKEIVDDLRDYLRKFSS